MRIDTWQHVHAPRYACVHLNLNVHALHSLHACVHLNLNVHAPHSLHACVHLPCGMHISVFSAMRIGSCAMQIRACGMCMRVCSGELQRVLIKLLLQAAECPILEPDGWSREAGNMYHDALHALVVWSHPWQWNQSAECRCEWPSGLHARAISSI